MKFSVDVVIPVHNSVHWLSWCLEELFRFKSSALRNVYVVDDRSESSQENRIVEIVQRYSKITLIRNQSIEGGFGYACNLGAEKSNSDLILFLNTDCFLTEGIIDRLSLAFNDQKIALACPLSNNSPDLTYPMYPGRSYRDMAFYCSEATKAMEDKCIVEACTVVGNCLMVRKNFFTQAGGFSSEWGIGYGEETDLHMKAISMGLKGVVHLGCYVYHYGGGTFNYKDEIEGHRQKNYQLFMSKWADSYKRLANRCEKNNPLQLLDKALGQHFKDKDNNIHIDVLFYLPGIDQSIGGLNAVVAICNDLIKNGVKAACALVGITSDRKLKAYKDPVLFNFFYFVSDQAFLSDRVVVPKVVFSTIFTSSKVVAEYARDRNAIAAQFVQGYEGYFENGTRYYEAIESYKYTEHIVTTSSWLFDMVNRHLQPNQHLQRLPLMVNEDIFFPGTEDRDIDVCMVFRSALDKGQWLLVELLDRIEKMKGLSITVLCSAPYQSLKCDQTDRINFIDLPIDQYSFARLLRRTKVFVDASHHEGFGLMPLEAAMCGCALVVTDSGGVRDFVQSFEGALILGGPTPERHIAEIEAQLKRYRPSKIKFDLEINHSWQRYLSELVKNSRSCLAPAELKIENSVLGTKEAHKSNTFAWSNILSLALSHLYRLVFPYIPKRLHLALKMLILGRY